MQILQMMNQMMNQAGAKAEAPKAGDMVQLTVKERVSDTEAVVSINGSLVKVKFEGGVPKDDRLSVAISGTSEDGQLIVRVAEQKVPDSASQRNVPANVLDHQTSEAVREFKSRGMEVTKENVTAIKAYLSEDSGTIEEKMKTIKLMAEKGIPFTLAAVKAVTEAMNGNPLPVLMEEIESIIKLSESSKESKPAPDLPVLKDSVKMADSAVPSQKPIFADHPQAPKDPVKMMDSQKSVLADDPEPSPLLAGDDDPENTPEATKRFLVKEPLTEVNRYIFNGKEADSAIKLPVRRDVSESVPNLRAPKDPVKMMDAAAPSQKPILADDPESSPLIPENAPEATKAFSVKEPLMEANRYIFNEKEVDSLSKLPERNTKSEPAPDLWAPKDPVKMMDAQVPGQKPILADDPEPSPLIPENESLENEIATKAVPMKEQLTEAERYLINETVQALPLDSKNILVTEISEKLSQMAIDFKKVKQEVTRNLDNTLHLLESPKIPQANVKQIIDSTIHKLDKAIMQSDFLLYADMKTEKNMLQASSRLAEAKSLLAKGEVNQAHQIVKEVKTQIESLIFKPSVAKVQHYVSVKAFEGASPAQQVSAFMQQVSKPFAENNPSARQTFELVRSLGLTHETDAVSSMMKQAGSQDQGQRNPQQENLKSALMRLMGDEETKPQLHQKAEQVLNQITGQQLLNKQDTSGQQNLFFQLPLLLDKQVENVKIYIQSRKNGEKVDWENCSLVFSLETKKLGEVGVVLTAANRNVSLTFQNDKDKLEKAVEEMTEVTKERFKEIGYQLQSLGTKPSSSQSSDLQPPKQPISRHIPAVQKSEKGFDFTI
ncbi:hypothetical protein [Bacillus massiliglaciei]|uniref:hypothetical protein n=1 Tax=Bacillus massiliglaciei TaxID=1816693 RepID=UPI000A7163DF|nr:hypothetical protein [Bacillus massiliglaciei]